MELPEWAAREEHYNPGSDRDYFISRSLLRLLSILTALRSQSCREAGKIPAALVLLTVIAFIVLIVLARTTAFLWAVLALELVLLCFHPGRQLRRTLSTALAAAFFCALIVAPSFWLGSSRAVFFLPLKTFLTVTALLLMQQQLPWHELTGALRTFHVPSLVIFILDTTLRYIALLGAEAADLLTALKLRSVGHNKDKKAAMSGVAGMVLQKTSRLSQEMYEAMCCRCFTGEYIPYRDGRAEKFSPAALGLVLVLLAYVYLFIRLEGAFL
ncbi:energy-coupling factor transporter transmembrane protein EcfT [Megasphaera sp.]|uniref:energy-coupling factor transporter transmembrane component T family protein n=1 Tax=Megasphaera sp. TaxID=2023260 RepID=UPI0035226AF8